MNTPINTYQQKPTLSDSKELEVSKGAMAYFRGRLSNKIHALVISEFAKQESLGIISKAGLARRVGKKPEQITRWLGSSGNWTIETLSDLLLGMGLEPSISLKRINDDYSSASISKYKSNEKIVFHISDDNVPNKQLTINYTSASNINHKLEFYTVKKGDNHFSVNEHTYKVLEI